MRPLPSAALVAAMSLASGCFILGPDDRDLEDEIAAHRAQWVAERPQTYQYDVEHVCYCPEEAMGPVRVIVSGEEVVSRTYVDDGSAVSEHLAPFFPSVDGLFDVLQEAVDQDADQIHVSWDAETGIPREFFIDYSVSMADEEQGYTVVAMPQPGS